MINRNQFNQLADAKNPFAVSIYIPTYRVGREQEDMLRFKNAIRQAGEKLQARYGLQEKQAESYLSRARQLLDDQSFWQNQSDGLAVFIDKDRFEHYSCPIDFEPFVYVAPEFYLRPLVPLLVEASTFHILALSRGAVKFYSADQYQITEIDVSGLVPENMAAALLKDDTTNDLTRAGGPEGQRGSNNGVLFGRGADLDQENEELKVYFDRVDRGITDYLCDDRAPLVLAGVDELIPIYQAANGYEHLFPDGHVSGNVEEDSMAILHEKAWTVLADHFSQQYDRDKELFESNLAADEASFSEVTIIPAAVNGRVAVLWLDKQGYVYGHYDQSTNGTKILTDEDQNATELYNLAAISAYRSGARVYNVSRTEMPRSVAGLCAIYRYKVDAPTTNLEG